MSSPARAQVAPQISRILFATDFSACSRAALPYARGLAERYGAAIHVVHVLAPEPRTAIPMDRLPAELDTARQVAAFAMETFLARDPLKGVTHTATVERGHVGEILTALIQQEDIDVMVVGTHGRRGVGKLVLGSVAEAIFRMAPCPVLTVGPHVQADGTTGRFARILYATDFSSGSMHALPYALSLARANDSYLMLVHAVPDSVEVSWDTTKDAVANARQRLADMLAAEPMAQVKTELMVECGPAAATILNVASSHQADLIIMGAHRASVHSVAAHLPWATASAVVCQARCPVLTVRS